MTEKEYREDLTKLLKVARQIETIDLSGILEAINRVETVGPIGDPTLFRKASDNLSAIKSVAKALVPIKILTEKLRETVLKTMVRGDMHSD